jgi:hypothetical protein
MPLAKSCGDARVRAMRQFGPCRDKHCNVDPAGLGPLTGWIGASPTRLAILPGGRASFPRVRRSNTPRNDERRSQVRISGDAEVMVFITTVIAAINARGDTVST